MTGELTPLEKSLMGQVARLESELAALREKYRWRKQGEEPAPEDIEVLMYDAYRKVFLVDYYCYRPNIDYVFWRPLDLPEVERQ